ncbi:peptide-methionine (S)-S-oxide reductase MsrA [Crocinitomicaceae bacterium]|nr:peptide-methionine (S)-S-oxide reductase MsrA [Crocinitomicaceae bacterium]MDB3906323.1 peptide-methionine (S)-S-oxide reductase MsrA [Crocinitomicaceae bacterium]MDC0257112.1 peptide-methionine (S)-S-oxide reductase MsrA [Crocinitomicaceae bacterium]
MKSLLILPLAFFSLMSCAQQSGSEDLDKPSQETLDSLQTAYFASGCFWCVEAVFESVDGVAEAVSGYAGGDKPNPNYQVVSSGNSRHAETVKVYYDSTKVSFETLVEVFFNSHDPSTKDSQGPDNGPQYRSIAFYQNENEASIIRKKIEEYRAAETFSRITTEVTELEKFYDAEDYHQDYERLHPNQGYIKSVSIPRLNKFKKKMPWVLKDGVH